MTNLLDIAKPLIGRGAGLAQSALGTAAGQADGLLRRVRGGGGDGPAAGPAVTDQTLKSQVESALSRVPGVSRSKLNVTVARGVVTVHGEVRNQGQMAAVETAVRAVPGVTGYESLLHLPKTPAPSTPKAGTRKATTRKPAAKTKAAATGRTERVNRDKTAAAAPKAEPTPVESAAAGEGRRPAPLGSKDDETASSPTGAGATAPEGAPASQAESPVAKVTGS